MKERIKIGNVYFEIPEGRIGHLPDRKSLKAEKCDTPEPLEVQHYIYRPNDPFGASIDEAHAQANISPSHKVWVKVTWFILFVISPLIFVELRTTAAILKNNHSVPWKVFMHYNAIFIPIWFIYYMIWRRKIRK